MNSHRVAIAYTEVWICEFPLTGPPTPAQDDVPGEVFLQGEKGAVHQGEEEVALHQQPAVVCQDGVVGEHQHDLTRHLSRGEKVS